MINGRGITYSIELHCWIIYFLLRQHDARNSGACNLELASDISREYHEPLITLSKILGGKVWFIIKRILLENGYPENVISACVRQKFANFAALKRFGLEKCPVYLRLPWIGDISLKYENQIKKAINFCFSTVNPRVVYNIRVILPSIQKDCVSTHQKRLCQCMYMYVYANICMPKS